VTTADLDLDALLRAALDASAAGARIVLDAFGAARNVREKGPGDWVSDADTASAAPSSWSCSRTWRASTGTGPPPPR